MIITQKLREIYLGHLYKSKFRHNSLLLEKNVSLDIMHILRNHFLFAPRVV